MPHDYAQLDGQYSAVIALMPVVFTSHQFIQRLAQRNQVLYIDALVAYRNGPVPNGTVVAIMEP